MKNNTLRASLIKSAVLLVVISLIIYLTMSSPEGSVWGAIGTIIYTIFKTIQLVIGLVLAFIVCLVVLAGIFFGGVAMLSTDSAAKMYNQLRTVLKDTYGSIRSCIPSMKEKKRNILEYDADCISQMNENFLRLDQEISEMKNGQMLIENNLQDLQVRLESNEQEQSITRLSDWLRAEEEKTLSVQEKLTAFGEQMKQVKEQVQAIEKTLERLSSGSSREDIAGRIAALEEKNSEIAADLGSLREKVEQQEQGLSPAQKQLENKGEAEKGGAQDKIDRDEHRIFSYIESQSDKEKIIQLATEAVKQDMTYAQATDYITGSISKKSGKILADHPTLTQDFIREIRKKF